jgi:enamine deaminase RidA (YjgF/YER057c/UK114 family)
MTTRRYGSGDVRQESFGYSQLVVAGPNAYVSGCTSVIEGVVYHEGDPYHQALVAFGVAIKALGDAGFGVEKVVRTRMYVVHTRDVDEVGRAHKALFDAARPAGCILVVAKLLDARTLVEVEVDAYREAAP